MFPDLPIHRLRRAEKRVRAACERHGIPHNSEPWPSAIGSLLKAVALYSLPIRTTQAREERRTLFDRLVAELNEVRAEREAEAVVQRTADKPVLHTLRLARSGLELPISSGATLLEALESAGVSVSTGCRKGACKTCVTRKIAGRTTIERRRVRDTIELCVARPVTDVTLDL